MFLLIAAERSPSVNLSADTEYLALTKFALASLLLGAAIGGLWTLPIWNERVFFMPWGAYFYNYAGVATALRSLHASRPFADGSQSSGSPSLAAGVAGMTLAIASLEGTQFFLTFAGWLGYSVLATFVVSGAPELAALFAHFLGFNVGGHGVVVTADASDPNEGHSRREEPGTTHGRRAAHPHEATLYATSIEAQRTEHAGEPRTGA